MNDPLQLIVTDIAAYLRTLESLQFVPVKLMRPRDEGEAMEINAAIDSALAGFSKYPDDETGKAGICILIQPAFADLDSAVLDRQKLQIKPTIRIIEQAMVNMGEDGTQVSCEEIALAVLAALHGYPAGGYMLKGAGHNALEPVTIAGLIAYDVNLAFDWVVDSKPRVTPVKLERAGNMVTLTTPATEDADIYYTLDGVFPDKENGLLFDADAPFEISEKVVIRACAYKAGMLPSQAIRQIHGPTA